MKNKPLRALAGLLAAAAALTGCADKSFVIKDNTVYNSNISYHNGLLTVSNGNAASPDLPGGKKTYYVLGDDGFTPTQLRNGTISIDVGAQTLTAYYQYYTGPDGKQYTMRIGNGSFFNWIGGVSYTTASAATVGCVVANIAYIQINQGCTADTIIYDLGTGKWHYIFDETDRGALYSYIHYQYSKLEVPYDTDYYPYAVCLGACPSPDGTKIAYVASNSINSMQGSFYIYDLKTKTSTMIYDTRFPPNNSLHTLGAMEWLDDDTLRISPPAWNANAGENKVDFRWDGAAWAGRGYGSEVPYDIAGIYYVRTVGSKLEFESISTGEKYLFSDITVSEPNRYILHPDQDFTFDYPVTIDKNVGRGIIFNSNFSRAVFRYDNTIYLLDFDNCTSRVLDPADYGMKPLTDDINCYFYFYTDNVLILNADRQACFIVT